MSKFKKNNVLKNTTMLYILNITKLVLPLLTLPYLTRVFSVDVYGVTTYVKSIMSYLQILIDCGFILSGTKDIVRLNGNKQKIGEITGNVILGKVILSAASLVVLIIMILFIPILRENIIFTFLSFIPVFLTTFLLDFLFRGLERMEVITYRFLIMKSISTVLTFLLVKSDHDMMLIPILDIIGSVIAIIWINTTLKKLGIHIRHGSWQQVILNLKDSFSYFISTVASSAFGALNTVVVGLLLSKSDVAYWSIVLQLVNAAQALYTPIVDGIYPEMVRDRKLKLIKKVLLLFTPIVVIGCVFTHFAAPYIMLIIGGNKYVGQSYLLRLMIPMLFISFYSMLFGWPMLGAIDKVKETTVTTVSASLVQVLGITILIMVGKFSLISLTVLRFLTEFVLLVHRLYYCWKYRNGFVDYKKKMRKY